MSPEFSESTVEDAALEIFEGLGYAVAHGPDLGPDGVHAEREDYKQVILRKRLREALRRINPGLPRAALEDALSQVLRQESPSLMEENKRFHRLLVDGLTVEYQNDEGRTVGAQAHLVDWEEPGNNDWLVLNQFTVKSVAEHGGHRRADVVVFVNGLPLAVFELKTLIGDDSTVEEAYQQFQTYKEEVPDLFRTNEVLITSNGSQARMGSLTADWSWFLPWRTVEGDDVAPKGTAELDTLIRGVFEKQRFLDLVRNFITFHGDGGSPRKIVAAYHQFHAVQKGVEQTVEAASPEGDRRVGVVWHTQGSGKSLTMSFYAGKIIQQPAMENPTLVVITDRNDLDDQLFETFSNGQELLRQEPVKAESREDLREKLQRASGGVIFTTIQKFFPEDDEARFPELSDRRNIVVIADEAHRSQYGFIDGFARHMHDALPNASFMGFTGTPIDKEDRSTIAVFGNTIHTYDIERAVEDGATVPIYYENRLAKIHLDQEMQTRIDEEFDRIAGDLDQETQEKLKDRWASLEALVGADQRLQLVARDLVHHFEQRLESIEGKGMTVCISRRVCVDLYDHITDLRPEWHHTDDDKGEIKVVMSGSASDPAPWQQHIRSKEQRRAIADRVKDADDPLKLVIVCDMWLTGFDAPPLHTMYVDKPMHGHTLMQAIARVNRVFRDKPGGLVVDYIGLANDLKRALTSYTEGDRDYAGVPQEQAVKVMLEKLEVLRAMLHKFDYSAIHGDSSRDRMNLVPAAADFILSKPESDAKERFVDTVTELSKAYSLAATDEQAASVRDEVAFLQAVKSQMKDPTGSTKQTQRQLDSAIRQIVSDAVAPEGVIDIFETAGLKRPDISILSDDFLREVKELPHRNLAVELLQRLINDEIKSVERTNVVQARSFQEMLEHSIQRYKNRSVEAAQVIEELIDLAKDMKERHRRGEELGLSDDEVAFYDALAENESAEEVMGSETLQILAQELVETVRESVSIDWTVKKSARAKIRVEVKRLLRRYGYPPDLQEEATRTVVEQAERLSRKWVEA